MPLATGLKHLLRAIGGERHVLDFSFDTNGSSAPASIRGDRIKSITHNGTGDYLVTFYDSWNAKDMIARAHLSMGTPDGSIAVVGAFSASGKTLHVWTMTQDGTSKLFAAADVAANADNRVSVQISLRARTVTK